MTDSTADLGALRSMGPSSVLAALQLVRQGRIFDLGALLGSQVSKLPADRAAPFRCDREFIGDPSGVGLRFCSEVAHGHIHQSTHIDALIHAQCDGEVFGGHPASSLQNDAGWTAFGAETIPPIVCRGVLIDLSGSDPGGLPDGYTVGPEELAAAVEAKSIQLKLGDAVLIRTGKIRHYADNPLASWNACPGISSDSACWLADRGMTLFGIDTASPDPLPITRWKNLVHEELLVRRGVHIIENVYLEDLAGADVSEFAFFCSPLKIQGASGSWVRPIAMV